MRRILFVAIMLGVLAGIGGAALTQPLPLPSVPLFAAADPVSIRSVALPPEQVGTLRTRLAQLDPAVVPQLRGGALTLNLFEDAAFMAVGGVRTDGAQRGLSSTLWTGYASGVPHSNVIMLNDATGNIDLRVLTRGRNYFVQSLGGGLIRISEIDPSAGRYDASNQRVIDVVETSPTEAEQQDVALNRVSPRADDGSVIDVMVVYTPAAVNLLGSEAATRLAIEAAVALSNVTYENSSVDFRLRLVHLALVDYVESGYSDLGRLDGTSDGHMDIVHQWRNDYAADMVALVPGTSAANRNYCGRANLPLSMPAPNSAFSITEALCISDITFAHELGHNMGKAHDHANAGFAIHPYAFGYQDLSTGPGDYGDWVTVMAYSDGGECPPEYIPGECPAIAYWSDNEATYNGKPLGNPGVNGEDNVQSLNETALDVANYRVSGDGGANTPVPQPTLTPLPTPGGIVTPMPLNGGFEFDNDGNGTPDGWKWASVAGKHKCDGARRSGSCALLLKPGAKITQIVPLDTGALGQGDEIGLSLFGYPKPDSPACATAVLKVVYADTNAGANADGKDKLTVTLPNSPAKQWTQADAALTLDAAPAVVKLKLKAKGCAKSYHIDDVVIDTN